MVFSLRKLRLWRRSLPGMRQERKGRRDSNSVSVATKSTEDDDLSMSSISAGCSHRDEPKKRKLTFNKFTNNNIPNMKFMCCIIKCFLCTSFSTNEASAIDEPTEQQTVLARTEAIEGTLQTNVASAIDEPTELQTVLARLEAIEGTLQTNVASATDEPTERRTVLARLEAIECTLQMNSGATPNNDPDDLLSQYTTATHHTATLRASELLAGRTPNNGPDGLLSRPAHGGYPGTQRTETLRAPEPPATGIDHMTPVRAPAPALQMPGSSDDEKPDLRPPTFHIQEMGKLRQSKED